MIADVIKYDNFQLYWGILPELFGKTGYWRQIYVTIQSLTFYALNDIGLQNKVLSRFQKNEFSKFLLIMIFLDNYVEAHTYVTAYEIAIGVVH